MPKAQQPDRQSTWRPEIIGKGCGTTTERVTVRLPCFMMPSAVARRILALAGTTICRAPDHLMSHSLYRPGLEKKEGPTSSVTNRDEGLPATT
jgi:hypothetical protein